MEIKRIKASGLPKNRCRKSGESRTPQVRAFATKMEDLMEKITDLPLGEKFVRQSLELTAILTKLKRGIPPNRREALAAHRQILSEAIGRTLEQMVSTSQVAA